MTEFDVHRVAESNARQGHAFNAELIEDFRAHNGTVTLAPFAGRPVVLLHHIGAKSGLERVNPVAYTLDGDNIIVIASNGGAPTNPAWYHNLRANPNTTVELGPDTIPVTAEPLAHGPERDRLFQQMTDELKVGATFQKKTDRLFPVVVLHRR